MNIKIITKSGKEYLIENLGTSLKEMIHTIKPHGFTLFDDIAIRTDEIEAIEQITK